MLRKDISGVQSVVSSSLSHRNKLNSIAWLFRDGSIRKYQFTLRYITSFAIFLEISRDI